MAPPLLLSALALCLFSLSFSYSLSPYEDPAVEVVLEALNKPAAITIENNGDLFDCVDVHRQPAFDHSLLKNHTVQMKPHCQHEEILSRKSLPRHRNLPLPQIGLKGGGCPAGTVPIRRTSKDELLRAASLKSTSQTTSGPQHFAAYYERKEGERYYGTEASTMVYGFPDLAGEQMSGGMVWVVNDVDLPNDNRNSISAGWAVFPLIFKDTKTRLLASWTGAVPGSGCYNILCLGFVQVSRDIPLGVVMGPISSNDGPQYSMKIKIFKDSKSGDWWLVVNEKEVGYWPTALFGALKGTASTLQWGGLAGKSAGEPGPPMGSGRFAAGDSRNTSSFFGIKLVDETGAGNDPIPADITSYADAPVCYSVGPMASTAVGYGFLFGGPGGDC